MGEEDEVAVLRGPARGAGVSGCEYAFGFDRGPQDGDEQFMLHGVTVVGDPYSAPYLQGATIDFLNGLEESGFKIDTPNVSASCGCGHSFQVEEGAAPEDTAGGCGSGCAH